MIQPPAPPFRVFEALISGVRYVGGNFKILSALSLVPFVVGVGAFLLARGVAADSFWVPVFHFPLYFMIGMLSAAVLRFMVLGEAPKALNAQARAARNNFIVQAGGVYAAVQFLFAGLLVGLLMMRDMAVDNPEALAPYMPLFMGMLIFMTWAMRWVWLSVPVALGWDARGFYTKLGTWGGSFRVMGLYVLCSVIVNACVVLIWQILGEGMQAGTAKGVVADVLLAAGNVGIGVLFAVCTGMAVRQMLGGKVKVDA